MDKIPVFNRSGRVYGFMGTDGYVEISPGFWTTQDRSKREIKKAFVMENLIGNKDFSIMMPNIKGSRENGLTIAATIDSVTGWGKTNANVIAELSKLRKDITLFPLNNWWREGVPRETVDLMDKRHQYSEWALVMAIPSELPLVPSQKTILYSMWETAQLPEQWREPLSQVKHLIVPSRSQIDIFEVDASVVPLGVNTDIYHFKEREPHDKFRILTYGLLSSRKSPVETIYEVCYRAFYGMDAVDDWEIVLKTRRNVVGSGGLIKINDPHVQVLSGDWSDEEMAELCFSADCGIMLSKFEGYGLPAREMMSTGLPVILSDNTGHSDDCNPEINIPIPTKRIIPAEEAYSGVEDWKWEEPDFELAAVELRKQYDQWKERHKTQSNLGRLASDYILKHRTWAHTARGVQDVLEFVTGKKEFRVDEEVTERRGWMR